MADPRWWHAGIVYQVYPRSFQDSNRDGIGDLPGIRQRLPYLADLGVDAIWLSPIFASPMRDFGYDISDYCVVDPTFGTMQNFDDLLHEANAKGLKIILDLVPNHTSCDHPWFVESRASRSSDKRDWYIWRDPSPDGGPPNNWLSDFGGSAWELDHRTGQYYYHAFLAAQPDLNWRNSEVRAAIHDVMRFWLSKGVHGFRIDALWHLIKDDQFRDNPRNPDYRDGDPPHWRLVPLYTTDRPEVHEVVAGLRKVADQFGDCLLIGEVYLPHERLVAYYGRELDGVHLPFNFSLLEMSWHAGSIAELIHDYERALPKGSWPNWVLGNHDRPRIATRVGREQARVAAMMLLTLRGTPTIYYGDEIGMENTTIRPEDSKDPLGRNVPALGRDGARSPMQWSSDQYAGFSEVPPWSHIPESASEHNVETEAENEASILNLYRKLIATRHAYPCLTLGDYHQVITSGDALLYTRANAGCRTVLVALNLGDQPTAAVLKKKELVGHILLSTFLDRAGEVIDGDIALRPNEGLIIELA